MDSFYEHPGLGFRLPLPAGWELLEDPRPGVSLVAAAPERPDVFRANLVVSIEAVNPGLDLETWQAEATAMLPGLLEDCLLLDQEVVDLPAGPALRRLVHHAGSEGRAVTLEQWTLLSGGHGTTLSFSVASADYDGLADTIAGLVAAFEPPTAASGPLP